MSDTHSGPLSSSHWGLGIVQSHQGQLVDVSGHPQNPHASPINQNIATSHNTSARVLKPTIRTGWLQARVANTNSIDKATDYNFALDGKCGQECLTEVSLEIELNLIADELQRVKVDYGDEIIVMGANTNVN